MVRGLRHEFDVLEISSTTSSYVEAWPHPRLLFLMDRLEASPPGLNSHGYFNQTRSVCWRTYISIPYTRITSVHIGADITIGLALGQRVRIRTGRWKERHQRL